MVYDENYMLLTYQRCRQSVRSICQYSETVFIVGQNEGFIELISLNKQHKIEVVSSKRFDKLGHIF